MTDLEIAANVELQPITRIAAKLGVPPDQVESYGKFKAKLKTEPAARPAGKLILVTAVNPTPFGEGKTTVSVGLADGISKIGKRVCLALREPSLGPVFGVKGGATGGGYAQVGPMEDINLHFTGDFHAITSANNLLSALIDNHIKQGNALRLDAGRIEWKRCLDLNDRALRVVECGLGGEVNGTPRMDGFQITAASEIMAVICLSADLKDLKMRLGRIVIGYDLDGNAVTASALGAADAMAILLKETLYPNLAQTLEGTPAIIHGGPFANIAHGCNSIRATKLSMSLAGYTVTEAGFGADLGAEKFMDIKCRAAGLRPDAVVLVATVRALKYNGGFTKESAGGGIEELVKGLANLEGHLQNLTEKFGVPVAVAVNRFLTDTDEEIAIIQDCARRFGADAFVAECWAKGGNGCIELAKRVTELADIGSPDFHFLYPDSYNAKEKIEAVAKNIYGAGSVSYSEAAERKLTVIQNSPYAFLPVCIAKTQYSFSQDPKLLGRPRGFDFFIKDILIRAGSGFLVAVAGDILLMPGLSAKPAALGMTISDEGKISGLF